jgi:hypothetical protein
MMKCAHLYDPPARLAVALALVVALVMPIVGGEGRAYAQEATAPFVAYGAIAAGDDGGLPAKVRATVGDVVCGTADVIRSEVGRGFYVVVVASSGQKPGCGVPGSIVQLKLLDGEVDPGALGAQAPFLPGGALRVDFAAVPRMLSGAFVGKLPDGPGAALLQWTGSSGVPIEQATATIGRDVVSVHYWDVQRQVFRSFVAGALPEQQTYTLVDAGDTVLVHVR